MLQRLIAFFFVLTLAGQVLAGVCVCLENGADGGHAKMSCCAKKKSVQPAMKKKACCDAPCGEAGESLPRSHSESQVKIPVIVRKAVEKLIAAVAPRMDRAAFQPAANRENNASPLYFKPPVIYLQNHAFLI
jgi:hypothetical protein